MVIFDLKIDDKGAEEKLRNLVKGNFDKFVAGIRKCRELEIKFEEEKY